jgi:protein phosphatase
MTVPTTRVPPLQRVAPVFSGAGMTHAGKLRDSNEDSILTDPSGTLWAVADGMGGYGYGDVASDIVIECLSTVPDDALAGPALQARLEEANQRIRTHSLKECIGSIGATVVAMLIQNSVAHLAWVGDCRAYLMRAHQLRLLTRDHTVVQDLVDQGLLTESRRENHPESHVVTRAVGFEDHVQIDIRAVPLVPGDRLLLCSDGLTACLGDHQISDLLSQTPEPEEVCRRMVSATLEMGAPDNVSVVSVFAREG